MKKIKEQILQIRRNKKVLCLILIVLFIQPPFIKGQQNQNKSIENNSQIFEIIIDKSETDSISIIEITIINSSSLEYFISIGDYEIYNLENPNKVYFNTSYSEISDPLLMPKLEMPFYYLKQRKSISFQKEYNNTQISEIQVYFDFFKKEDYPYSKLKEKKKKKKKMKNKTTYHSVIDIKGSPENLFSIYLEDYYMMHEKHGQIKGYYKAIKLK